ncbi:MAG: hypothetical protein R2703_13755 [Micropruina glycogenica]
MAVDSRAALAIGIQSWSAAIWSWNVVARQIANVWAAVSAADCLGITQPPSQYGITLAFW